MTLDKFEAQGAAMSLQRELRDQLETDRLSVRVYGQHLIVDVLAPTGPVPSVRLTRLARNRYGLSFMRHTGKWFALPYSGTLQEMADTAVDELGGFLDPALYTFT